MQERKKETVRLKEAKEGDLILIERNPEDKTGYFSFLAEGEGYDNQGECQLAVIQSPNSYSMGDLVQYDNSRAKVNEIAIIDNSRDWRNL